MIILAIIDLIFVLLVINIAQPDYEDPSFLWKTFSYGYFATWMRPVLFVLSIRSVKSFWRRYLSVIKGSLPMVFFIIIYIFWFAWMGNRLFSGTIEGIQYFPSVGEAFFSMFVLLTTANYPDISLASYAQARHYAVFYIVFLMIGLFMFMNLLLAIFYASY